MAKLPFQIMYEAICKHCMTQKNGVLYDSVNDVLHIILISGTSFFSGSNSNYYVNHGTHKCYKCLITCRHIIVYSKLIDQIWAF